MARKWYELKMQVNLDESQVPRFTRAFSPYSKDTLYGSPSGPFYEFLRMWMCDEGDFGGETPVLTEVTGGS